MPRIVPLHVAVQHCGLDMNSIDFLFHGSAMSWLAKRDNPMGEYLVGVALPHIATNHKIMSVSKARVFSQNHTALGFQFERLVAGKTFSDPHGFETVQHLQIMQVGKFRILFCAEVDAVTAEGNPVHIGR